jgi:VTC domain
MSSVLLSKATQGFSPDLTGWRNISLTDLNNRAALLDRAESKYVFSADTFNSVLQRLRSDFEVLVINGKNMFTYDTTYYDTQSLLMYRQHAQGKRLRLKVRSRHYVDNRLCFFELKLKGQRDRTIKLRKPYSVEDMNLVTPDAQTYVNDCVRNTYGAEFREQLGPSLAMRFQRVTLVGTRRPERMTIDFGLHFAVANGQVVDAPADTLIVEVKSPDGRGRADEVFRSIGARQATCSKYCVGLNMVRDDLSYNTFNRTLRTHFEWSPPPRPAHSN